MAAEPTIATTVRIPEGVQGRYDRIAQLTKRSRNYHMARALERYAEEELAELEKIQEGLAQADRSEFVPDEEMEAFFARYGVPAEREGTLLTMAEAAEALGVRSVYIVNLWCTLGFIHGVEHGKHTMIPLSEIERVADSDQVRAIRASDVLHAESSDLGTPEGLTDEQLLELKASRPGKQPQATSIVAASPLKP